MKIVHLSDLHFGTETDELSKDLLESVQDEKPEMVIISGDFTQIASTEEFIKAKTFIKKLEKPVFAVPGNHDVPAFDIPERLLTPYKKYKSHIHQDLNPTHRASQVDIIGLNSARRALPHWNWANGAISNTQRRAVTNFFADTGTEKFRICVLHHPIHKIADMPISVTVFGRKRTLECLHNAKVDLVLTGHVHHAAVDMIGDAEHQTAFVSASTALSSRKRGQENGYNVIEFDNDQTTIKLLKHDGRIFAEASRHTFQKIS